MKFTDSLHILLKAGIVAVIWTQNALATSYRIPDFPAEPTIEALLDANGLAQATEQKLLEYVLHNAFAMGAWIPTVAQREEAVVSDEYIRLLEAGDLNAREFWQKKTTELTNQRLHDPRRIVDAALRRLGQVGTPHCIEDLVTAGRYVEPDWAQWKARASIQEILARHEPGKQPVRFSKESVSAMGATSISVVAPLLRDLPGDRAEAWAWTLWQQGPAPGYPGVHRDLALPARLWLARSFARRQPQTAATVFRDGLQSRDGAVRTLAEMLLRQVLGGSLPHGTEGGALLKMLEAGEWKSRGDAFWQTWPKPLDTPLVLRGRGGASRADLVWLDASAKIVRRENDVWPRADSVLPNGLGYGRSGDSFPTPYVLVGVDAQVCARFDARTGQEMLASHGGLWTLSGAQQHATEFAPDGSVLWQFPLSPDHIRAIAPYGLGRVLCLGYGFLECRNRRGDVVWKTNLEKLDDPRYVLAVDEGKFLLSCGKSIGWLTQAGAYTPILENLGSPLWIRYHPEAEWIIFDGANWQALIYDFASKQVTGRIDLDDDGERTKSKYATDGSTLPE